MLLARPPRAGLVYVLCRWGRESCVCSDLFRAGIEGMLCPVDQVAMMTGMERCEGPHWQEKNIRGRGESRRPVKKNLYAK